MRIISLALIAATGLSVTACDSTTANRSVYSERQPVVTRNNYTLDLNAGESGLAAGEQRRLVGWLDALELGYGDRVSVDTPSNMNASSARTVIAAAVAQYGLLVKDIAPVTAGELAPGVVRVVVSRSTAAVPGCPDFSHRSHTDFQARTSENYGCGTNSTLAAMIADPEDLVRGTSADGEDQTSASKAIRAFRDKKVGGK